MPGPTRRERYQVSIRQAKAARSKAATLSQMVPLQLLLNAGAAAVAAAAPPTARTKPPAGCAANAIKLFVGGAAPAPCTARSLPRWRTLFAATLPAPQLAMRRSPRPAALWLASALCRQRLCVPCCSAPGDGSSCAAACVGLSSHARRQG
jgi:hypothetical protein